VINYAWANPTTGIREQASTREEARLRVWTELRESERLPDPQALPEAQVYEQEAAGWSSKENFDLTIPEPWDSYAFTDPTTGTRCIVGSFDMARIRIAEAWPEHAPVDSVTIYRQRLAFDVRWDDPRPEAPAPAEIERDTPSSLIEQVMDGSCGDLGRAQLLATLWIAESLQEVAGALHYMSPGPSGEDGLACIRDEFQCRECGHPAKMHVYKCPEVFQCSDPNCTCGESPADIMGNNQTRTRGNPARRPGVFRTLRRWWRMFWGTHWNRTLGQPNCAQCGQMLADPDGTICPKCAEAILTKMAPSPHIHSWHAPPRRPQMDLKSIVFSLTGQICDCGATRIYRGPAYGWTETPASPNKPHVYRFPTSGNLLRVIAPEQVSDAPCAECGKPFDHAIHGYTGD